MEKYTAEKQKSMDPFPIYIQASCKEDSAQCGRYHAKKRHFFTLKFNYHHAAKDFFFILRPLKNTIRKEKKKFQNTTCG
ncbi:MAG: hypothetical protein D3924_12380 [Candidatus Electrothrix sp. AR4]|nr:hypothetical protein [Candidatus Electrothrix sp. AR4]